MCRFLLHRVCRFCRSGSARKHYRTESLSPEPQYPVYGSHHIFCPCRSTSHTFRDHFYNIFRHDNPPSEPFCYWPSPKYYRPPDRYYLQRRPREYYDPTTIPEIFATSAPCNVPSGLRSPQKIFRTRDSVPVFHPQYPFQSFLHGITGALPLSRPATPPTTSFASGAIPRNLPPDSSPLPHTIPQTCVPCPLSSYGKELPSTKSEKAKQPSYQIRMISNSGIQHSNSHRFHTSCPTMQLFRHLYLFPYPLHLVPSP